MAHKGTCSGQPLHIDYNSPRILKKITFRAPESHGKYSFSWVIPKNFSPFFLRFWIVLWRSIMTKRFQSDVISRTDPLSGDFTTLSFCLLFRTKQNLRVLHTKVFNSVKLTTRQPSPPFQERREQWNITMFCCSCTLRSQYLSPITTFCPSKQNNIKHF